MTKYEKILTTITHALIIALPSTVDYIAYCLEKNEDEGLNRTVNFLTDLANSITLGVLIQAEKMGKDDEANICNDYLNVIIRQTDDEFDN